MSTGDDKSKETTKIEFDKNQNINQVNDEITRFREEVANGQNKAKPQSQPVDAQSIGIGDGDVFQESSEEEDGDKVPDYTEEIAKISQATPVLSQVIGMCGFLDL